MYHVPMCVMCGEKEVQIVVNSAGGGYCSTACEQSYQEEDCYRYDAAGDGWGYDDCEAMYDNDPNPYAGTYSEE
jgi:hypothetical protein